MRGSCVVRAAPRCAAIPCASHTRPAQRRGTFGAVAQRTGFVVEIERQPNRYPRPLGHDFGVRSRPARTRPTRAALARRSTSTAESPVPARTRRCRREERTESHASWKTSGSVSRDEEIASFERKTHPVKRAHLLHQVRRQALNHDLRLTFERCVVGWWRRWRHCLEWMIQDRRYNKSINWRIAA